MMLKLIFGVNGPIKSASSILATSCSQWKRNGSYYYTFYEGVRFKRCVPGETNLIDEPTIPKLYPNGNYNKTWCHEELDDYLSDNEWKNNGC